MTFMSACNQSWSGIVNKKKKTATTYTLYTRRWTFTFRLITPFTTHGY